MGFMIGNKTDGAFLAATGYLKIVAVFYVFCFTGNTFAGYFDGIGRVNIPFIGAVGHITLRVILSWIFVSQFQLNAVAVATGIGWMLVNLFWSGCYFSSTTWKIINFKCYLNKCLILLGFPALDFLTYHSLTTHFSAT